MHAAGLSDTTHKITVPVPAAVPVAPATLNRLQDRHPKRCMMELYHDAGDDSILNDHLCACMPGFCEAFLYFGISCLILKARECRGRLTSPGMLFIQQIGTFPVWCNFIANWYKNEHPTWPQSKFPPKKINPCAWSQHFSEKNPFNRLLMQLLRTVLDSLSSCLMLNSRSPWHEPSLDFKQFLEQQKSQCLLMLGIVEQLISLPCTSSHLSPCAVKWEMVPFLA